MATPLRKPPERRGALLSDARVGCAAAIVVSADHAGSCMRAAELVSDRARASAQSDFSLVLSGGRTPVRLFELLAAGVPGPLPWARTRVFWADERCVAPDAAESNYRVARETLLDRVSVAPERIHRMPGEMGADRGARGYRDELERVFGGAAPAFDVALLGLGADGHTCSLFPGSPALTSAARVEGVHAPVGVAERITLTPAGLAGSRLILFLVSGRDKAPAVALTLEGDGPPEAAPARAIRGAEIVWLLDTAAASCLCGGKTRG